MADDNWVIEFVPNDPADDVGLHAVTCEFTGRVCECLNCKRTEPCRYRIESSQDEVPHG